MNTAVIVAAGRGTRMRASENKVFLRLRGVPVIVRTVKALRDSGAFSCFVVVTGAQETSRMKRLLARHGLEAIVTVGGESRQESVRRGLAACPGDTELVAIHDGARPLADRDTVLSALESARVNGSGIASVPVKDTIKRASGGLVVETPPRECLYAVQTPQAFRFEEIRACHEQFAGESFTDDAALLEQAGIPVYLSPGSYENIKITTPEDLIIAGRILSGRERKEHK